MRIATWIHVSLFASLLLCAASSPAPAAGAGFDEVPEPDELEYLCRRDQPARLYSFGIGPHLSLPRGDASLFARPYLGLSAGVLRWLSPRFALVTRVSWSAISRQPLVPADVAISTYSIGAGVRAATDRTRSAGLHVETLFARHTLRIERPDAIRAHHGGAMILGAGAHIRLAGDLRLEAQARFTHTDSSMSDQRVLRLRVTTLSLSLAYDL